MKKSLGKKLVNAAVASITAAACMLSACGKSDSAAGSNSASTGGSGSQTGGETSSVDFAAEELKTVSYSIDGNVFAKDAYLSGDVITAPDGVYKYGYTFKQWSGDLPQSMDNKNYALTAAFTANNYVCEFILDGQPYSSVKAEYGALVAAPAVSSADGLSFSGWIAAPASSQCDRTVYGFTLPRTEVDLTALTDAYTITQSGIYSLSGKTSYQIIIDAANADVVIELNGAQISFSGKTAPVRAIACASLSVCSASGTTNAITASGNKDDGAIYSASSLAVYGNGQLAVSTDNKSAIYADGALTLDGTITVSESAKHAFGSATGICVYGGSYDLTCDSDAFHTDGFVSVFGGVVSAKCGSDFIDAATNADINADITAVCGGDGIKAVQNINVYGGDISISAQEDSIKADGDDTGADVTIGNVRIYGGTLTLIAANDGIQAEQLLEINSTGLITITAGGGESGEVRYDESSEEISQKGVKGTTVNLLLANLNISSFEDAVHSNGNITIDHGSLNIKTMRDGIAADGALVVNNVIASVKTGGGNAMQANDSISTKGLKADLSITIGGGSFTLDCLDDAVHSNSDVTVSSGSYSIMTGDDGFHSDMALTICGGVTEIEKSYEGLEGLSVIISGGVNFVTSSDDGINAAGGADSSGIFRPGDSFGASSCNIAISGGSTLVNASGDGVDANGNITMTGGTLLVFGPTDNGNGALDYDGTFTMSGGVLLAVGSSGMAQAPNSLTQYALSVTLSSQLGKGSLFSISSDDFSFVFRAAKNANSIIFSSPEITNGKTYTVSMGGSYSGGDENCNVLSGGSYSGGTTVASLTVSQYLTTYGSIGIGGTPGGGMTGGNGQGGFGGGPRH